MYYPMKQKSFDTRVSIKNKEGMALCFKTANEASQYLKDHKINRKIFGVVISHEEKTS